MEEFIDDIVKTDEPDEPAKTETEMAAEIQGTKAIDAEKVAIEKAATEKAEETPDPDDSKPELGSEATPDVVQPENEAPVAESDDVKALAAQLGWREDHTGDDAVDAKTYILKSKDIQKSMGQHNKDLKDQLQALGGSVSALKKHNENVFHAEVKKLTGEVEALKKERRAAIELADVAKVDELDKQIDDIQKDIDTPKLVNSPEERVAENPVYDEWVKDNDWYLEDDAMANFADNVAQQYAGAPLERVYAIVRTKVQEVFPDKFEAAKVHDNKQQEIVKPPVGPKSPVESSSVKGSETSFSKADLTSDQIQIMNQFVRGGIMTEEQYVNDIAKMQ